MLSLLDCAFNVASSLLVTSRLLESSRRDCWAEARSLLSEFKASEGGGMGLCCLPLQVLLTRGGGSVGGAGSGSFVTVDA